MHARGFTHTHTCGIGNVISKPVRGLGCSSQESALCMDSVKDTVEVGQPPTLAFTPSSLFASFIQQGSQDSAGGQEGLVPPPFSAFPPPPPPPPQNGLTLDYGGSLYTAGAVQGPVEAGGPANSAANAVNSLSAQVSFAPCLCVWLMLGIFPVMHQAPWDACVCTHLL